MGRVMPGMESMVATTLLDEVVGAQGLAGVKSMDIWLILIAWIKPTLTYDCGVWAIAEEDN